MERRRHRHLLPPRACHPRAGCSLRLAAALGVPAQRLFGDTLVSLPGVAKYWRLHFGTGPGETKMNYLRCPSLGNSLAVGRNLGPRVGDEHSLSCNLSRVLATAHGVSPIGPVLLLARPHGAGPLPATPESSARSKKHPSKNKNETTARYRTNLCPHVLVRASGPAQSAP